MEYDGGIVDPAGVGPTFLETDDDEIFEETFAYSRFALPWLIFCFALLWVVLGLTFWQQAGDIKNYYDGIPRQLYRTIIRDTDDDAGLPEEVRNLRIAAVVAGAVGIVGAFIIFFVRPGPKIRLGACAFFALLIFAAAVLSWVAFGLGLAKNRYRRTTSCQFNGSTRQCRDRSGFAITAIALDGGIGVFGVIAAIILVFNAKKGHWRLAPRGWEEEQLDRMRETPKERLPGAMVQKNVSFVRKVTTSLLLLFLLAIIITQVVFIILIHEGEEKIYQKNIWRGRSDYALNPNSWRPFEVPGWSTRNTRIRYGAAVTGILAIMLNFLPFRSRIVAFIIAFLLMASSTMLMIAFGFDIHELRVAGNLNCPTTPQGESVDCVKGSFIATAVFDFLASFCLLIYLFVEYMALGRRKAEVEL
jgi:TRAP-type C4-dicarboxylate transport system permease small subunit